MCVTWHICTHDVRPTCDNIDLYVWNDSFICVAWLIRTCKLLNIIWGQISMSPPLACMAASYLWHGPFTCVTWLICVCDMNEHRCERNHLYVWYDFFMSKQKRPVSVPSPLVRMDAHMNEARHTCKWVMSHIWMNHVPHLDESVAFFS